MVPPPFLKKLSLWLATAAAVAILVSVPVSQILLALAICTLLLSGMPLRWPRIAIPLGLFLAWTLLSLAFSPDPAHGMTQVNKFLVFATMLTIYSSVRSFTEAKPLILAWLALGTYAAGVGLWQFARRVSEAHALHRDFYLYYVNQRMTGLLDHWMTFSGQQLYLLLMLAAALMFAPAMKKTRWIWMTCGLLIGSVLILSFTRGVWAAAIVSLLYLLWAWKKWSVVLLPLVLIALLFLGPAWLRQRADSLLHPEKNTDSNGHRNIVWLTGWEMVKAHPLLGVGPEEISKDEVFNAYLPNDIPRPLPPGDYKHLHSIYIHYAAERGIPAAILLTFALVMALVDFQRALRTLPPGRSETRFLLHWASATVIGTMIVGATDLNLGLSAELTMFLVVMCLGYMAVTDCYTGVSAPGPQKKGRNPNKSGVRQQHDIGDTNASRNGDQVQQRSVLDL